MPDKPEASLACKTAWSGMGLRTAWEYRRVGGWKTTCVWRCVRL